MKIYPISEYIEKFYGNYHGAKADFCLDSGFTKQALVRILNTENAMVLVDGSVHSYVLLRTSWSVTRQKAKQQSNKSMQGSMSKQRKL